MTDNASRPPSGTAQYAARSRWNSPRGSTGRPPPRHDRQREQAAQRHRPVRGDEQMELAVEEVVGQQREEDRGGGCSETGHAEHPRRCEASCRGEREGEEEEEVL